MKIAIDGFGGDYAPTEVLKGASLAAKEYGADIIVTGNKQKLFNIANENSIDIKNIEILDCDEIIGVEDDPSRILKDKKNSSMGLGLKTLSEGKVDAFVSAGSTAALVMGASFIVKRIKGVKRSVFAPIIPHNKGCYILVDGGANIDCKPTMLLQFGIMGSIYMNKIMNIKSPRVGLINVGKEKVKGTDTYIEAYNLLSNSKLNFVGNVEAREVPEGICDVLVADGFSGNIILKLTEGMGKFIGSHIKEIFGSSFLGGMSAFLIKNKLQDFKKKMDYKEYGGACLMGIRKPVIKAHGSSNAKAFKNTIRQSIDFVKNGIVDEISSCVNDFNEDYVNCLGE